MKEHPLTSILYVIVQTCEVSTKVDRRKLRTKTSQVFRGTERLHPLPYLIKIIKEILRKVKHIIIIIHNSVEKIYVWVKSSKALSSPVPTRTGEDVQGDAVFNQFALCDLFAHARPYLYPVQQRPFHTGVRPSRQPTQL
jgi:hypothetical protein